MHSTLLLSASIILIVIIIKQQREIKALKQLVNDLNETIDELAP